MQLHIDLIVEIIVGGIPGIGVLIVELSNGVKKWIFRQVTKGVFLQMRLNGSNKISKVWEWIPNRCVYFITQKVMVIG